MNYLYIMGSGSKWSDNELRYSLRSLEANCPIESVTLIGVKPAWVTGVQFVPFVEPAGNKISRVYKKLVGALPYVADEFVLMNDDFYILKPTEYFPLMNQGTLREALSIKQVTDPTSIYTEARANTLEALRDITEEPLDFDLHVPFPCTRDLVFSLGAMFPFWDNLQFRTLYGNWLRDEGIRIADVKIDTPTATMSYYSTTDYITEGVKQWLRDRFPAPSRFEMIQ